MERWKQIVSSPRFQQLLLALVLQILGHYNVLDAFVLDAVSVFFVGVAAIGSADKFAEKLANK